MFRAHLFVYLLIYTLLPYLTLSYCFNSSECPYNYNCNSKHTCESKVPQYVTYLILVLAVVINCCGCGVLNSRASTWRRDSSVAFTIFTTCLIAGIIELVLCPSGFGIGIFLIILGFIWFLIGTSIIRRRSNYEPLWSHFRPGGPPPIERYNSFEPYPQNNWMNDENQRQNLPLLDDENKNFQSASAPGIDVENEGVRNNVTSY